MLSRVANSLYWLSRYLERAENLARLVEVNRYDSLDRTGSRMSVDEIWRPLLYATNMESAYKESEDEDIGWFFTFSDKNPDSIRQCVAQARENARMVRDQISEEIWRELNRLYLFVKSERAVLLWEDQPEAFHRRTIESCLLLSGLINSTILRDQGWQFIQFGKFLERADKTTRVLDMLAYQGEPHRTKLASALRSCSAFSAFQCEYRGAITLAHVMSFLLFSSSFPRSVRFSLRQLDAHLHEISGSSSGSFANEAERLTGSVLAQLNFSGINNAQEQGYHNYLDSLQKQFNDIGQEAFETYILLPSEIRELPQNAAFDWNQQQHDQQQQ